MLRSYYRFCLTLVLTLGLLFACQSSRSTPAFTPWNTDNPRITVTARPTPLASSFVWWEAETPLKTNFPAPDRHPFAPTNSAEAAMLSNQQWIGVGDKREQTLFLEYQITVPTTSDYFFYTRKFWRHGPFRWRWDDQPWQYVGDNVYLMDNVGMRQFVGANWVSLGKVALTAGRHQLRIELTELEGAAAFDCFLLSKTLFQPQGNLQPNQQVQVEVTDGFSFTPQLDRFAASPIDLRSLNEAVAGEQGWIRVKGEEFVHANTDRPERFWAINSRMETIQMDKAQAEQMARFLAKRGVNMVRLHGRLWSDDLTIAPATLDKLFTFITALKQQGIYTCLSIYFPVWLPLNQTAPIPGYTGQNAFSLLFFNSQLQKTYFDWWRTILTTTNPYTGVALRDDPAVAMVELVNEDSYFFWTFTPYENVPATQMATLEQQFGRWLTQKYGSPEQALNAWNTTKPRYKDNTIKGDDPAAGRLGFMPLYQLVEQRESLRAQDTAAFLAHSQSQFFQQAIAMLRQTLHYQGLIYASNWITANAQILGPLDKYTNTVADFMDRHGYFEGRHEGKAASYSLNPGDLYQDRSALLFQPRDQQQDYDFSLPIMDMRYNNLPSTITEIGWLMPNQFRAEFPLLAAAYGLLQGSDGFFFFVNDQVGWEAPLGKFTIASPVTQGQFPATALIYRKGLLKAGKAVVNLSLKVNDLLQLRGAPIPAPQNLDAFRAKDIPPGQTLETDKVDSFDPLAFLVGKVNVNFTTDAQPSQVTELSSYIDRTAKTVRSSTGELLWNYDKGLVTVNAPQVQAVTGFLQPAGTLELNDVTIASQMPYGTIILVALDNQPIAVSRRLLLQVMSEEQNLGWQTSGEPPKTIQSIGSAPILVRTLSGDITFKRSDAKTLKVTALDANGKPIATIGNAKQFQVLPDQFYYLIQSE